MKNRQLCTVALIFLLYLLFHLWPIARFGYTGFGYDTGIYRHYITGYFERMGDDSITPFGFASFSNPLMSLGDSVDTIMFVWYLLIAIGVFWAVYLVVREFFNPSPPAGYAGQESVPAPRDLLQNKNSEIALGSTPFSKQAAVFAVFLFTISSVQFAFYWWYYYRNFLALFLLLVTFLLVKRKSWLAIFTLVGIGIIHPLTLAPLGLALVVYWVVQQLSFRPKRSGVEKFLFAGTRDSSTPPPRLIGGSASLGMTSLTIATVLLFLVNWQELSLYLTELWKNFGLAKNFAASGQPEFTGSFITPMIFVSAILAYLPYGLLGLWHNFRKQTLLASFFSANLLLIIIGFAFYRRFLVFLDLTLIFFAADYFSSVFPSIWKQKLGRCVVVIFITVLIGIQVWNVARQQPLINEADFFAIRNLDNLAGDYVLAVDSAYAPWLYGFTNKKIIAPGMLDYDLWSREDWGRFWFTDDNQERIKLLEKYNISPIYIFVGDRYQKLEQEMIVDPHFTKINEQVIKYSL